MMISLKTACAAAAAVCLLAAGCAKLPEKAVSPTLKIEPTVTDRGEAFRLMLNTGLQNENGSTALLDVEGRVFFRKSATSPERLLTLPFTVPVILPFNTGRVDIEKTFSETEIAPLLKLLGSDAAMLRSEKVLDRAFMDDDSVGLEITGHKKKDIIDLLQERVNEKDK